MVISLETIKKAIDFLHIEEKSMHLALMMESHDIGAKIAKKIIKLLEDEGEINYVDLFMKIYNTLAIVDKKKFDEAIDFLQETKQIVSEARPDKDTQESIAWWRRCV